MWKKKQVLVVEWIIKTKQVNWFLIALIKCPNYDLLKINKSYHLPALLPFQHKGREKKKKQKITRIFYKLFVWCLYIFFFFVSLGSSYLTGCDEAIWTVRNRQLKPPGIFFFLLSYVWRFFIFFCVDYNI